jgi:hypothetical protein
VTREKKPAPATKISKEAARRFAMSYGWPWQVQAEKERAQRKEKLEDRLPLLEHTNLGEFIAALPDTKRSKFETFLIGLTITEVRKLAKCSIMVMTTPERE